MLAYSLSLQVGNAHRAIAHAPKWQNCHAADPLHPFNLLQVSATLLASLFTYQPIPMIPVRVTTRRATPMAGLFILELCRSFWLRWWVSWQCTCSLKNTDICAPKAGLPSWNCPSLAAHLSTATVTTRTAPGVTATGATTVHNPFRRPWYETENHPSLLNLKSWQVCQHQWARSSCSTP